MGTIAARKCRSILANAENVVAIELLCAAQALDLFTNLKPGKGTMAAYKAIRKHLPHLEEDRVLSDDIAKMRSLNAFRRDPGRRGAGNRAAALSPRTKAALCRSFPQRTSSDPTGPRRHAGGLFFLLPIHSTVVASEILNVFVGSFGLVAGGPADGGGGRFSVQQIVYLSLPQC